MLCISMSSIKIQNGPKLKSLKRNREHGDLRKDMLRGKSGVFSISATNTLEILSAEEKEMVGDANKNGMAKTRVKVVPVTSTNEDSNLRQADKPLNPPESMETIEEQRRRLLNEGSTMPKPPMKKPGKSTMVATSKFGRANAGWQ